MKKMSLSLFAGVFLVGFAGCGTDTIVDPVKCGTPTTEPCELDNNVTGNEIHPGTKMSRTTYETLQTSVVRVVGVGKSGSGFFIDNEGHIVTNNHVVSGSGILKVEIQNIDGKKSEVSASRVAVAECSDLAVLKLGDEDLNYMSGHLNWFDGKITRELSIATSGFPGDGKDDSGNYHYTYSEGVINYDPINKSTTWMSAKVFAHDGLISGGNSGGPVVEIKTGEVVGINFATRTSSNRSLAISATVAKGYVERMINEENIYAIGITPIMYKSTGVLVDSIDAGGKANKIGIKQGDIIIKLAGLPLYSNGTTLKRYCDILKTNNPNDPDDSNDIGDVVPIQILRTFNSAKTEVLCDGEINGKSLTRSAIYRYDENWVLKSTESVKKDTFPCN